jgi:hypothetical protein
MENAVRLLIVVVVIVAIILTVYLIGWILSWIWYGLYIAALSIVSFIDSHQIFLYGASSIFVFFACIWLFQATQIYEKNRQRQNKLDIENKHLQDITDSFNKNLESLKKKVNNIEWKK